MTRLLTALIILLAFSLPCAAQEATTIYSIEGAVEVKKGGSSPWTTATVSQPISIGDSIKTGKQSRAAILLASGVMVRLGANSLFTIKQEIDGKTENVALDSGDAHFFSRSPKVFPTIDTPMVSAAIRGTEVSFSVSTQLVKIALLKGLVDLKNNFGELSLNAGELALVEPNKAPVKSIMVDPLNEIQWTLYYPNLVSPRELEEIILSAPDQLKPTVRKAVESTIRSSQYMEKGLLKEAAAEQASIQSQITALPSGIKSRFESVALAQSAIIELVAGKKQVAKEKAQRALTQSPNSACAQSTYSYILQSEGDLEQAQKVLNSTTARAENEPLLLARQAEMHLSFGESEEAEEKITQAYALAPDSSYVLTVKGFTELARLNPEGAVSSFEKAISLNPSDGLPHLGLGLAKIRLGHLEEGRVQIQQAAHLEPQKALYRSYLGKAFFEEEDENLAAEEYDRAIALDPEDPTPYLYRSFYYASKNQPVQALDDLEKSISINNNRAVYRSRLMLDQDLSVRSNSLAQVYDTLGFSQIARIEAIKSLSRDYTNHSAHLMLSQTYEGNDKLIQGGLSEFFISRLLSPVNFNLVRPSQAGVVSANEYSAVFDRDITRYSVGTDGNTKDKSVTPNVLISGVERDLGYALSFSDRYQDGYRDNDRENEQQVYGTLQYQLTPEDTLLLDANAEIFDNGDTFLTYDPTQNDSDLTQRLDDYFVRLGFNHRFHANSVLIGQVVANKSNYRINNDDYDRPYYLYLTQQEQVLESIDINALVNQHISFKSHGVRGDLQHIYDGELISNVFGGGILDSHQDLEDSSTLTSPEELADLTVNSSANNTESSQRIFNYTTLHAASWADIQFAMTYSKLHLSGTPLVVPFVEETNTMTKWDPKAGVVLTPFDKTTIRAAYFESLGTAGVREFELIEPTIISGFNQTFFDLFPGTTSRNYAVGIDQKLDSQTYMGVEGLIRKIKRPYPITVSQLFFDVDSGALANQDIFNFEGDAYLNEDLIRAYIYQVLGKSSSATIDYQWTRDEDNYLETDFMTNRLRLGLNHFFNSGFFLFGRGTWRSQDIGGLEEEDGPVNDVNGFWIVDIGTGYRFHKRHGQITLSLNNVLDNQFHYMPTGYDTQILPGIGGSLAFSYNF